MSLNIKTRLRSVFQPYSLQIQLLSRTLLILGVLLVLIGLFQYLFMQDVIYKNKASSLQSQIMSIPPFAWRELGSNPEKKEGQHPFFFIPEASLVFIDQEGKSHVLSTGHDDVTPPKLNEQAYKEAQKRQRGENYSVAIDGSGAEQLVVLQPISTGQEGMVGIVQVSTPINPLKELLFRQLLTFLVLALIAMLIGLFGFLPILKKTLVPLFTMVGTAEQIDAGNLARRFPTKQGQMEVDRLAVSFNGMLERLEASFEAERETKEQMRRFVADASHELRTPLTSIHGFLEVLLRGAVHQPDQLNKALHSMYSESNRLNKLVRDLLLLTKLDQSPQIDLAEGLLDAVIHEMEAQIRILVGNRKLSLEVESNLICMFDTDKMKQVILNLVHNAVQHTDPEKGHIWILLERKYKGVQLSIQDNGPGISTVHLPHVFDRFYRSDSSRTRKYGGAGLGLSITKSIVDAHGGTIRVNSIEGQGCTFIIWLPT